MEAPASDSSFTCGDDGPSVCQGFSPRDDSEPESPSHRVRVGFLEVSNFYKIRPIFKASNFYKIRA